MNRKSARKSISPAPLRTGERSNRTARSPNALRVRVMGLDVQKRAIAERDSIGDSVESESQLEWQRTNLAHRLGVSMKTALGIVHPHYGSRPPQVPENVWNNLQVRVLCVDLPVGAPENAHAALRALRTIHQLKQHLEAAAGSERDLELAICAALDLGSLLTQIEVRTYEADQSAGVIGKGRRSVAGFRTISRHSSVRGRSDRSPRD